MAECPYCASEVADDERYCPRCGERLTDWGDREGIFDREVVRYLDGVRNGARTFDPDAAVHERFEVQLRAAVGDFAHLADLDVDLRAALDLDELPTTSAPTVEPGGPETVGPASLGLVVLLGLVDQSFHGPDVDELRVQHRERG